MSSSLKTLVEISLAWERNEDVELESGDHSRNEEILVAHSDFIKLRKPA